MNAGEVVVVVVPFAGLAAGNLAFLLGRRLVAARSDPAVRESAGVGRIDGTNVEHLIFTRHVASSHWQGTFLLSLSSLLQWALLGQYVMTGVSAALVLVAAALGLWIGRWSPRYHVDGRLIRWKRLSRLPQPILTVVGFALLVLAAGAAGVTQAAVRF